MCVQALWPSDGRWYEATVLSVEKSKCILTVKVNHIIVLYYRDHHCAVH